MYILSPEYCYSLQATALRTLHDIGNGAIDARRCWKLSQKMPSGPLWPVQLHHIDLTLRRDEFHFRVDNSFLNCPQLYDAESLKDSRRMGDSDFYKNLRAYLFGICFSNELISAGSISLDSTLEESGRDSKK
jgi:hypothetical protein